MTKIEWPHPEPAPFVQPAQRADLIWVAVDLDATLAKPTWTPDDPAAGIGEPIWENVYKLRRLVAAGYKVIVHTSRSWAEVEAIEAWLNHYMIPFKQIECAKVLTAAYVDDKGVHESALSWIPGESHCKTCTCHEEAA